MSTLGKVTKRGWDWLGITPSAPERIGGLIEVPALAECLTLNKSDFIRTGARGAVYLAYRKAMQEAVSRQLAAWGDMGDRSEQGQRRAARPVERDLEAVLMDLADKFPLLASLVEQRAGGQRRLPIGGQGSGRAGGEPPSLAFALVGEPEPASRVEESPPQASAQSEPVESRESALPPARLPGERGAQRPALWLDHSVRAPPR